MKPTLETRKPVQEISLEDLQTFPIWEFALDEEGEDGQDETWIQPVATESVPSGSYSQIVAASFSPCAFTRVFLGFMIVTTARGQFEAQAGAVVTADDYFFIPSSQPPSSEAEREAFARALGVAPAQMFPLAFELLAPLSGEAQSRRGTIEPSSNARA